MGRVDHGKTTLLTNYVTLQLLKVKQVVSRNISTYQIKIDGKPITFLDTPGHAPSQQCVRVVRTSRILQLS